MDLIVSPTIVAFNTQSGAPKLALNPGQLIDALVLQLIDATTVRLAVADKVIDVKTEIPLEPGTYVRLAVRGHGEETRWVIVGTSNGNAAAGVSRAPEPAKPQIPAPPHPAEPATEVTIGTNAPTTDAETAVSTPVRPDRMPTPPRSAQAEVVSPAGEFIAATRSAAARQGGLAPVFAELRALVAAPDIPVPVAVRQIASHVLATPANLDDGSGEVLHQAISRSGLFLEARLAGDGHAAAPPVAGDLKAALLILRQSLQGWLDAVPTTGSPPIVPGIPKSDPASPAPQSPTAPDIKAPPPPYRGAPTTGQQPMVAEPFADTGPTEIARALLVHTDSAIARQVLMQVASLPDAGNVAPAHSDGAEARWNLEIPFVTPQGTAIAHFEIARDGHRAAAREMPAPAWRANFSIDVEPLGPVHAQIALTGKRAAVRIWAERKAAATVLRESVADLTGALRAAALDAGDVVVRDGAPPRPLKPNPGRFLDRAS